MTIHWRKVLAGLVAIVGIAVLLGLRLQQYRDDPNVAILESDPNADWIRPQLPFNLVAIRQMETRALFTCRFTLPQPVDGAALTLRAMRDCEMAIDREPVYQSSHHQNWKTPQTVPIQKVLAAGEHLLTITVRNYGGPPCLLAYSAPLGIKTDASWACTIDGQRWIPVLPVTATPAPTVALEFPTVATSFTRILPVLVILFLASMLWTLRYGRNASGEHVAAPFGLTPPRLRWLCLGAWSLLAANNIWQLPVHFGHDFRGHLEYVKYIATNHSLPIASDGWQMFQSPLFYLLAAPIYGLFSPVLTDDTLAKVLRVLPLLCGLAQIEIVYRCARYIFPDKNDLQAIATVVGSFFPMHIYMSQVIGNEPMAGVMTGTLLLLCFVLLAEPTQSRPSWYFALLGFVWGLALLSKVTPVLLSPLLLAVVVCSPGSAEKRWKQGLGQTLVVVGACLLTSGWYFGRNWYWLGKPFAGGWDPASGNIWWQEPSYRTWEQLTSFGVALHRPIWSSSWSFWDALYSTMWLDGSTSSLVAAPQNNVWNTNWLVGGAWLGLVPAGLIAGSLITMWQTALRGARPALLFSWVAIAIYLIALIDLYMRLPIYSTAKASYTLGLLPCYAVLAATGAAPLLHHRLARALVFACLTCWSTAAYFAYFAFVWPG